MRIGIIFQTWKFFMQARKVKPKKMFLLLLKKI